MFFKRMDMSIADFPETQARRPDADTARFRSSIHRLWHPNARKGGGDLDELKLPSRTKAQKSTFDSGIRGHSSSHDSTVQGHEECQHLARGDNEHRSSSRLHIH